MLALLALVAAPAVLPFLPAPGMRPLVPLPPLPGVAPVGQGSAFSPSSMGDSTSFLTGFPSMIAPSLNAPMPTMDRGYGLSTAMLLSMTYAKSIDDFLEPYAWTAMLTGMI